MWCRSHEFASSVQTLISSNGRLIGVIDEGIIGQPRGVPTFWTLIARDAFNGKLLWRRPCDRINPHTLVAVDDKVYVTLESKGPLSILDAATGETIHTREETGKVHEISVCENRVILCTQLGGDNPGLYIAAAKPENGELLWKKSTGSVGANTLVAGEGRVCYCDRDQLVCLKLDSGEELWRSDVKPHKRGYAVLYKGAVFLTGGSTRAFSLKSGELLWTGPDGNPHARNPPGLFGANGLMWCAWGHVGPRSFVWQHQEEVREGRDPLTGEVRKTVKAERLVTAGHHIRCYPPKATSRYLLLNKRGVEFFDLQGGDHMRANWTRGACGYGMLPANGFLYTPPSQCFCYQGVLLTGLNALASSRAVPASEAAGDEPESRLQKGPAYASCAAGELTSPASSTDWPIYRHDVFRSGSRDASLPVNLTPAWETSVCPPAFESAKNDQSVGEETVVLSSAEATIHGDGARKSGDAIIAWRGKDTFATWEADIDNAGKQPVWLLQANQGKGGSVFELSIGREKLTGKIRHTDTWEQYVWIRVGEIEVAESGPHDVTLKPRQQVEGRLGNVKAIAIGGQKPPPDPDSPPKLRERPSDILTPLVAAGGKIFVAEPEAHMVHALRAKDGKHLWDFVADGRIDSPPTIHDGLCIFGSTDGYVYCLSAADGTLAWRFQAAPEDRQVCVKDRLESAWPVHGSVLVRDDKVYCTAGRSSHLDGGIHVYALDPYSGKVVHQTRLRSEEPDVTKYGGRPFDMEGAKTDLLVAGREDIYLFQKRFNADLTRDEMPRITKLGDRQAEPHLMTTDGFLDKTWFNRTYWIHSERWPGYYFTYRAPKSGQILVFDDSATYALKVYTKRRGHSPEFQPGSGYQLMADRNTTKPVLDVMDIGAEKGRGFSRTELPIWSRKTPIRVQGMVLADEHLYLAGPPDLTSQQLAYEAMIGKRNSVFQVISTSNGKVVSESKLPAAVVFDSLIAAGDRLYMSTMNGSIICLGEKK
ncbi:MAG: PQQ-binding-like beta-propeller repeat protein [Pirellulaceae bacterium]